MEKMTSNVKKEPDLNGLGEKLTTAENALSNIQPGDHVFVGSACATPRTLIQTLEGMKKNLTDVEFFHFLTESYIFLSGPVVFKSYSQPYFCSRRGLIICDKEKQWWKITIEEKSIEKSKAPWG